MAAQARSRVLDWGLTALRMVVGWHLLYEGVVKILDPRWTSEGYLLESSGWLAPGFRAMAESPGLVQAVDMLNMWGLTLAGACLLLGLFTRAAAVGGIALLLMYYLSNPPFFGLRGTLGEGSYLIVNKNLIEAVALLVVAAAAARMYGLDNWLRTRRARRKAEPAETQGLPVTDRRALLRDFAAVPALGAFVAAVGGKRVWNSMEEQRLKEMGIDGRSSATLKTVHFAQLDELKGVMSYGKIGDLKISRLIMGGNLIGGWAHSRDLVYVSELIKAYHDDDRVIATLRLAEKCGVNTLLTNPQLCRLIKKYWDEAGGRIQFISDSGMPDMARGIDVSVETGACACYIHGGMAENWIKEGKGDQIGRMLERIRSYKMPAGVAGHKLEVVKFCVQEGFPVDYWVKTLHHHNYWSAVPDRPECDNRFCYEPEETIELMASLPQPWIAYKVLAAGAIPPKDGFTYALRNGGDFLCVGMYDFQIVQDVNLFCEILPECQQRPRPWRA